MYIVKKKSNSAKRNSGLLPLVFLSPGICFPAEATIQTSSSVYSILIFIFTFWNQCRISIWPLVS